MIDDDTYAAALERAPEPHEVILGPVPCSGCSAWVEWAGVAWLALGSKQRHQCAPYLQDAFRPYPTRLRPTTGLPMAHRLDPVPLTTSRAERQAIYVGLILLALAAVAVVSLWPR